MTTLDRAPDEETISEETRRIEEKPTIETRGFPLSNAQSRFVTTLYRRWDRTLASPSLLHPSCRSRLPRGSKRLRAGDRRGIYSPGLSPRVRQGLVQLRPVTL